MVTNLDIFKKLELMMQEAESEMNSYLEVLKERHDYMTTYRQEYRNLNIALYNIKKKLQKIAGEIEENENLIKQARSSVEKLKIDIDNEKEDYTDGSLDKASEDIEKVLNLLNGTIKLEDIENAQIYLSKHNLNVNEIDKLEEEYKQSEQITESNIKTLISLINANESDYLANFKTYREACEENEEVFEAFDDIVNILVEWELIEEAQELTEALPDIEETRSKRPDPEPLLAILLPMKSNGLEYWKSTYRNSYAHDHNIKLANEIAYARRALLEKREYKGTKNAFDRVKAAYNSLSEYMYSRYHELGGTPNNYHGHEDRKR